jgi:hypothetical protein
MLLSYARQLLKKDIKEVKDIAKQQKQALQELQRIQNNYIQARNK